jgi:hypothetical protein
MLVLLSFKEEKRMTRIDLFLHAADGVQHARMMEAKDKVLGTLSTPETPASLLSVMEQAEGEETLYGGLIRSPDSKILQASFELSTDRDLEAVINEIIGLFGEIKIDGYMAHLSGAPPSLNLHCAIN